MERVQLKTEGIEPNSLYFYKMTGDLESETEDYFYFSPDYAHRPPLRSIFKVRAPDGNRYGFSAYSKLYWKIGA